jgi:hypothetical protein
MSRPQARDFWQPIAMLYKRGFLIILGNLSGVVKNLLPLVKSYWAPSGAFARGNLFAIFSEEF